MSASLGSERLKRKLQQIDDYEFEHFVADLWEQQGWSTAVEQKSSDAGVDIRAVKSSPYSQKQLIQAKRYSNSTKVGGPDIQQYASLKQQEDLVDSVVVVTTSSFTHSAQNLATDLNVKLVNGENLLDIIEKTDSYEIVDRYISTKPPDTQKAQFQPSGGYSRVTSQSSQYTNQNSKKPTQSQPFQKSTKPNEGRSSEYKAAQFEDGMKMILTYMPLSFVLLFLGQGLRGWQQAPLIFFPSNAQTVSVSFIIGSWMILISLVSAILFGGYVIYRMGTRDYSQVIDEE